jgi:hypothetical protein
MSLLNFYWKENKYPSIKLLSFTLWIIVFFINVNYQWDLSVGLWLSRSEDVTALTLSVPPGAPFSRREKSVTTASLPGRTQFKSSRMEGDFIDFFKRVSPFQLLFRWAIHPRILLISATKMRLEIFENDRILKYCKSTLKDNEAGRLVIICSYRQLVRTRVERKSLFHLRGNNF